MTVEIGATREADWREGGRRSCGTRWWTTGRFIEDTDPRAAEAILEGGRQAALKLCDSQG